MGAWPTQPAVPHSKIRHLWLENRRLVMPIVLVCRWILRQPTNAQRADLRRLKSSGLQPRTIWCVGSADAVDDYGVRRAATACTWILEAGRRSNDPHETASRQPIIHQGKSSRQEQKRDDFDQQLSNGDCKIEIGLRTTPARGSNHVGSSAWPRLLVSARAARGTRRSGLPTCTVSESIRVYRAQGATSWGRTDCIEGSQWLEPEAPELVNWPAKFVLCRV